MILDRATFVHSKCQQLLLFVVRYLLCHVVISPLHIFISFFFGVLSTVRNLGLNPLGEDTGTAEVLSRVIIEREDTNIPPLFFPCGSIKREVLPTALRENGVPLETLTVYQTAEHPDLEKNLKNYFTEQGTPASVAFFSPSGVKFCLEVVRRLSGEHLTQIKFAAIGPTTQDAMTAEGLSVSCAAEKPTAEHLAAAIAKALQ
ncbi:uroporphyrinogen-III synthase-like [Seriola lalandi dorsalis]|uniref:uroporphyrinogen-III synthase-like n=1 Tax=Seriola lalandi dorsalis TaxID=1841481 RepID=UPI000C6F87C4|nr:uroporphyrinogen-III synthase-like [Seriola lalandi dorsalis]